MRKYLVFLIVIFALFIGAAGSFIWYKTAISAPSAKTDEKRFVITKGSSATKIAADLAEAGLIKSALAFKVYTQLNNVSGSIPPGEFSIPQNLDIEGLIGLLKKGPTQLWVTIPEGLRREEIAQKVVSQLELEDPDASHFRQEFLNMTTKDEGYLFPDTYLFPRDASASFVISTLKNTFDKKFIYDGEGVLSREEAVVLASIIERETVTDEERPVVAGILLNRLDSDWPLQADATVQYVLGEEGKWWSPPTKADLQVNSPYNTYKITGLPPAPISNPGLSSLNAAANPADTDYFYYIHDKDGGIHYAETLDEHNANVAKYIR